MNKKVSYLRVLVGFLVLLMAAPPSVLAQSSGTGATIRQEELDQMLAPIALYPDSLLAQILVAATFPNEVVEADQWVRENEGLKEDDLNAALDKMDWDLSVKALVPFPKVLAMMSDKREWTQRLGDAFLDQESEVMDTVQSLRAKAYAQGNLKSTDQQKVVVRGESIEIEPANPRVVYVPAYNPTVIYGPGWHTAYPPYAYNPYYDPPGEPDRAAHRRGAIGGWSQLHRRQDDDGGGGRQVDHRALGVDHPRRLADQLLHGAEVLLHDREGILRAWLGRTQDLGVISAVVFREKRPEPIPILHDESLRAPAGESRAAGQGAQPAPRVKSGAAEPLSDDLAATGIGRELDHQVRRVEFEKESRPAARLSLRYEYRDALVKLGVLPDRSRWHSRVRQGRHP